ncbi:acyltransferase [Arthrobacter yangruifuii]|uniref:Acyltransferase n=1 Tax=Arthrobacter yangruifuii TaxID=2606616 RepID=A0A5N6MRB1_9MICC|nr:acyltransferase [Arthrobacter yangruifuii]KAD4007150.1 acyltransferase [Arthrobacter yangruifuii]
MTRISTLGYYSDERQNQIIYNGPTISTGISIEFTGSNNRLIVSDQARLGRFTVMFDCDNGILEIGPSRSVAPFTAFIRVGQDSEVKVGANVSTTATCVISAVEGTTVTIGNDVMIASENEIRADDAHPIFDVNTGKRVNLSRDIIIGNHVWLAKRAVVLGGSKIGSGSVIGFGAVLKGIVPNNCVAAGVPAKVVRRDIAWERPHLSRAKPFYKPDGDSVAKTPYWLPTVDEESIHE